MVLKTDNWLTLPNPDTTVELKPSFLGRGKTGAAVKLLLCLKCLSHSEHSEQRV